MIVKSDLNLYIISKRELIIFLLINNQSGCIDLYLRFGHIRPYALDTPYRSRLALALTFPMIITVHFLGFPDNGPIITGYLGSLLMAGAYLAIASFTSALTKNQVISFIISVNICLILVLLGWGVMSEMLNAVFPVWLTDVISQFSFTTHFDAIRRGVVDFRDIVYFLSIIIFMLMTNVVVLESKKGS